MNANAVNVMVAIKKNHAARITKSRDFSGEGSLSEILLSRLGVMGSFNCLLVSL